MIGDKFFIITLTALLLIPFEAHPQDSAPGVKVAPIVYKTIDHRIRTYGILSLKIEDLSFRATGRIDRFLVEEGEAVEAGQLLAQLETADAEVAVRRQRVELASAKSKLDRLNELFDRQFVQDAELEQAKADVETAEIALSQAQEDFDRCFMRAPSNGTILREFIESRTTIPAGTSIFSFQSSDEPWKAQIRLSDSNAFFLREGAMAKVSFAPYPGTEFDGVLSQISQVASAEDGLYTAEVTIETGDTTLRPGMIAEVDISQTSADQFYVVPMDALVDMNRNSGRIYVLDGNSSKVAEKAITVHTISYNEVALVESLEKTYEQVVVRGQGPLQNLSQVRIIHDE